MGDPAGIGLEITLRAVTKNVEGARLDCLLYADPAAVAATARRLGVPLSVTEVDSAAPGSVEPGRLRVVPIPLATDLEPGKPDVANAPAVIASIERATGDVVAGRARAVVTNPIAKSVLTATGFRHPGHTEFLAALADRFVPAGRPHVPVMMLASPELRVVPLTIHVPLAAVPGMIDTDLIVATGRTTARALQEQFAIAAPRLAIAGLNPHAGEDGTMGREDLDRIVPAVTRLVAEGYRVTGPHPADTLFHAAARKAYDAVVCMYHDQALIPLKTLSFDSGVNVTLGLPFVRTSPDHGTAFDIAGKGIASPTSLAAAILLADRLSARRLGSVPS
jgi:4-hydroxythreonine-4-phosphate dehydrogenase